MVRLSTLLTLKAKAAKTRGVVSSKREAQGKTNERSAGGDAKTGASASLYSSMRSLLGAKSPRGSKGASSSFSEKNPGPRLSIPKLGDEGDAAGSGLPTPLPILAGGEDASPTGDNAPPSGPGTPRYPTGPDAAAAAAAANAGQPGTPRYGAQDGAVGALPKPVAPSAEQTKGFAIDRATAPAPEDVAEDAASDGLDMDMVHLSMHDEEDAVVKAAIGEAKKAFDHTLAIAACCWMLTEQFAPKGTNKLTLEETLASSMEKLDISPDLTSITDETRRRLCKRAWNTQLAQLIESKKTPSAIEAAQERCAPWMARVVKAKTEVIDPNAERLTEHMASMKMEHINTAATELAGSRLRDVMKAKALTMHRIMMVAMDDVQMQFCGGMRQLASPGLTTLLSAEDISTLCTAAVVAVREQFDANYSIPVLEKELSERMSQATTVVTRPRRNTVPTAEADPLGWLQALIMGEEQVGPLPDEELHFLLTHVSTYLDPFLDGDVPPDQCQERSKGFYYDRLKQDWAATRGDGVEMRIPAELAYAQYVTHCITKLNANHGFGQHVPGLGRTAVPLDEQEKYLKQGVESVLAATERDFAPEQRCIGGLKTLTAGQLLPMARDHLTALFLYHNELGDALATANREGEEARRQERLRIWGYA
mmetsp:Transcript_39941/g.98886  ORF Transcript_39941/g.98886 Transcript_39941/m.98886 type:complete len:650 (-) Transcript_39941:374-2323(-)